MGIFTKAKRSLLGIFFVLFFINSCATVPELRVEYRVPTQSEAFKGKEIVLIFEDIRENREILGPGAKEEFQGFTGNFTLSIAYGKDKGFRIGSYDLQALFMEIFKKRFESLGISVVPENETAREKVVIALKEFSLDLDKRKWIAKMDYEARLFKDDRMVKKQMMNGQTDHVKILGRTQAHKVIGEIFTELINKMDIVNLFQEA
ncbi:MAG: hypothetical protein JW932_20095 [Deltaproteobacteria bacterium]|nr:hypothetical protein [Deltaproteobacteria bacterium]